MHRPRTPQTVRLLKLTSWTLLFLGLSIFATLSLGIWALAVNDRQLLFLVLGLLSLSALLSLVFFSGAISCFCPLCRMKVLLREGCQRNPKAARSFGSYRLRVATQIVTHGYFRCPYCGESTRCEARRRKDHPVRG